MVQEENFEVECTACEKKNRETSDKDHVTYRAEYYQEKGDDFVKVIISSSKPLKAQVGEKVTFRKLTEQTTLMESLEKEKKNDNKKVSGSSKSTDK